MKSASPITPSAWELPLKATRFRADEFLNITGILNPAPGLDTQTGGYLRTTILDTVLPSSHPQHSGLSVRGLPEDFGRNSNRTPAADPTSITTDYEYDVVGNVIAVLDPRGVKTEYGINELNEIWVTRRASDVAQVASRKGGHDPAVAEDLSGQDYTYIERYKRDANGNIVGVETENRDNLPDTGSVPGFYETTATYDILNNIRTLATEVDGLGGSVTYTAHYDENENLVAVQKPEGNIVTARYESRDFLWQLTRGDDDTSPLNPPPSGSSTNTLLYDGNGNVVAEQDAGDNNGDSLPEEVVFTYDGYNRVTRVLDPLGGETLYTYDPRGNVKTRVLKGHAGGPSPTTNSTSGNITFEETEFYYDERSRRFRLDRLLLENPMPHRDGLLTPSDNRVSEKVEYDRLGRTTFLIGDDAQAREFWQDGAGRPIRTIDEAGNETQIEFDDNGNPVLVTETETYPLGAPVSTRTFETFNIYDSLDRILSTTDSLGRTHRWEYDSRDNVVKFSDAVSWTFATDPINGLTVNAQGNVTRFLHDGRDRKVQCDKELRAQGHGTCPIDTSNPYNSDGHVTTTWIWDGNDRLSTIKDDKSNQISFQYDSLDRLDIKTYCDSTFVDYDYDADDNIVRILDPAGNEILTTYDGINRPIAVHANTIVGVVGTTDQQFEYDGLHRLTKSRDSVDATLDSSDWVVDRQWDSLSRIVSETQNGRTIVSTWKEENKRDGLIYPSGLSLTAAFDELDRLSTLADGSGTIVTYKFVGPIRVLEKDFGNGTSVRYHDGTLDDSAYYDAGRRPVRVDHQGSSGLLAGFSYQLDWANNRKYEKRVHDGNKGDNFAYDSLYRLIDFEQNVPSADVGQPGMGNEEKHRTWKFDGVQSWRENTLDTTTHLNTVNCENEYLQFQGKTISRDANGNLLSPDTSGSITYSYDFQNRLRSVTDGQGKTIDYDYDAEGRRVRISATGISTLPAVTEFVYDGGNPVEEWDSTSTLLRRFVTSTRLDDVLRLENLSFYPGAGTYYLHNDGNANVRALTDSNGAVVERYRYDAFGAPEFLNPAGQVKSSTRSDYGNPYLFTRRRYEEEIRSTYYYRARHYDPEHGRFMQREPGGVWFDPANLGNGYAYVGNNPRNFIDPRGEAVETGLDIIGALFSLRDMWNEPSWANAGMLAWDAASILPGVPGSWVKRGAGFLGDARKAQAASRRAKKVQGNAHHGPSGPPPTNRRPDADGGVGTSGNGRGSCSQGDGYDLGGGEGPGGVPLAPRAKDKYGSGSGSSSPPNRRSDGGGGGGGGEKKYDKHHMLPRALLKKLPERLRNLGIVRGMKGRKNIWPIERRLHRKLHRGGKRGFRGRGGKYNQRAMELLDEAIDEVGGSVENLTGEMLDGIREALAKEFKLGRFRPK